MNSPVLLFNYNRKIHLNCGILMIIILELYDDFFLMVNSFGAIKLCGRSPFTVSFVHKVKFVYTIKLAACGWWGYDIISSSMVRHHSCISFARSGSPGGTLCHMGCGPRG